MHMCIHVCMCMHVCVHYVHVHVYVCVNVFVCVFVCVCVRCVESVHRLGVPQPELISLIPSSFIQLIHLLFCFSPSSYKYHKLFFWGNIKLENQKKNKTKWGLNLLSQLMTVNNLVFYPFLMFLKKQVIQPHIYYKYLSMARIFVCCVVIFLPLFIQCLLCARQHSKCQGNISEQKGKHLHPPVKSQSPHSDLHSAASVSCLLSSFLSSRWLYLAVLLRAVGGRITPPSGLASKPRTRDHLNHLFSF